MTFTIGRFSDDTGPTYVRREAGVIDFGLSLFPTSISEARAWRHQLLGLAEEDQPVPITFGDDTRGWDSFYQITSLSVEDSEAWFVNNGVMRARIQAIRVAPQPAGAVQFELTQYARLRTNNDSVTTADIAHRPFVPDNGAFSSISYSLGGFNPTFNTVTTETGDLLTPATLPSGVGQDCRILYACDESNYYNGSARVDFSTDGGTTWYGLHGRAMFGGGTSVRLTNGRVMLQRSEVLGNVEIELYWWDGAAWVRKSSLNMGTYRNSSGAFRETPAVHPTVLRNRVESCAIRLPLDRGDYADISLDRGALHFEALTNRLVTLVGQDGFELYNEPAFGSATDIKGGIRKTTFSGGTKWVFLSPEATHQTLTAPAGIEKTTSSTFGFASQFAFGVTETNGGEDIISDYFATLENTQRLVL